VAVCRLSNCAGWAPWPSDVSCRGRQHPRATAHSSPRHHRAELTLEGSIRLASTTWQGVLLPQRNCNQNTSRASNKQHNNIKSTTLRHRHRTSAWALFVHARTALPQPPPSLQLCPSSLPSPNVPLTAPPMCASRRACCAGGNQVRQRGGAGTRAAARRGRGVLRGDGGGGLERTSRGHRSTGGPVRTRWVRGAATAGLSRRLDTGAQRWRLGGGGGGGGRRAAAAATAGAGASMVPGWPRRRQP